MKALGIKFPGSLLVFSPLKEVLNKFEKKEILKLVNFNNKRKEENKPHNDILILTQSELLTHEKPPYCWNEELKEKYIKDMYRSIYFTADLAKVTQEIYLTE